MANEKNNTKELVSEDDDPTAELEIPGFQPDAEIDERQAERESDSHTCGLDDSDDTKMLRAPTIPELQSDLKSRKKTIGQLQYDIQQLRSKWLGLEAEIAAREDIASNLLSDNDKLRETISRKNKLLKKRSASIKSLKSEIRQRDKDRSILEEKLAAQAGTDERSQVAQESAEHELQEIRAELEAARTAMSAVNDALNNSEERNAILETQLDEQQELAVKDSQALDEAGLEIEKLRAELESAETEDRSLNSEINLRDEIQGTLEAKITSLEEQLEAMNSTEAGQVADLQSARQEVARLSLELEAARHQGAAQIVQTQKTTSSVVRELQAQLEKTEKYADTLRFKINDSEESLSEISRKSDGLAVENAALSERVSELSRELAAMTTANEELLVSLDQARTDQEQELRTLRFELSEAQQSVTQTSDLNAQLASDLLSTRSFKDEMERMLLRNEEDAQQRIADLEKQVSELASTADVFEQKLETKNTAINVLLGELAKKTEQMESIGEIEEVIQEIDYRMSGRLDEPGKSSTEQDAGIHGGGDRERITRVLVGSIGNQELRFPLFKNRLTIGRTADNDIQLKTSYISRRHAVVVTEGDVTRVIDWGSKNGVYVNSKRVKECFLANGDIVAVGNAKFRYEERPKRDT